MDSVLELDDFVCGFCWERFDSPGELAAHEQAEEDREWTIDG